MKFISNNAIYVIEETIDIMNKNMSRNLKGDPEEQEEKDQLSASVKFFMKFLINHQQWNKISLLNSNSIADKIKDIIKLEEAYNLPEDCSTDIERTLFISKGKMTLNFVKEIPPKNFIYFRHINHLADLMQNYADPWFS